MHKYLFESGRKDVPQKRQDTSSRREVVFQVPKRRKKTPTSRLSPVSILTSPRLNTPESQIETSKNSSLVMPSKEFYSRPKSLLEQQYEQKVQAFVSSNEAFEPLDSPTNEETDVKELTIEEPSVASLGAAPSMVASPAQESSPKITKDSAINLFSQDNIKVGLLLQMSDQFVNEAYKCVLETNDIPGTELYYSLIKLALTCLHNLLENYSEKLNPQLEQVINYKIAKIYFFETQNKDIAEKYVSLALALATRHNLHDLLIASDLLHFKILKSYKPNILLKFLENRISYYLSKNMSGVRDLFSLMKAQSYLSTKTGLALSQLLFLNLRTDVEPTVNILSLLLEASAQIYHGNAIHAKSLLKRASNKYSDISYPSQLRGLHLLLSLYFYIQVGDFQKGKDASKELSKFITRQRRKEWRGWTKDGNIRLQMQITENKHFQFQILWKNSEEFVIEFYLLSAVLFLTNEETYEKASEILQKCVKSIEELLELLISTKKQSLDITMNQLTEMIIRLNYIRYFALYYQIWLEIVHKNDSLRIVFVQEFLKNLHSDTFSEMELSFYCLLEDLYMYLNALHHLAHGDLSAAKFLLLLVRKNTSVEMDRNLPAFSQIELGLGCEALLGKGQRSQLFLYSTLHLSLICQFELSICGQGSKSILKEDSLASSCRSLLSTLSTDLESAVQSEASFGVASTDEIFRQTLKLISYTLSLDGHSRPPFSPMRSGRANNKNPPTVLKAMKLFIEYQTSANRTEKERLLEDLQTISSKVSLVEYIQSSVRNFQPKSSPGGDMIEATHRVQSNFFDEHGHQIDLAYKSFLA